MLCLYLDRCKSEGQVARCVTVGTADSVNGSHRRIVFLKNGANSGGSMVSKKSNEEACTTPQCVGFVVYK